MKIFYSAKKEKRTSAFTLAEILITLGIIGVVSILTIPTLMADSRNKTYEAQLHKVYNELSQAALRYQTEKNALTLKEAGLSTQAAFETFMTKYFNVIQTCDGTTPCVAGSYRKLDGTAITMPDGSTTFYSLASGASICPRIVADANYSYFIVDVNGAKGPNILGKDLFTLYLYDNGTIDDRLPDGSTEVPLTEAQREAQYTASCAGDGASDIYGCFGKVLNDGWEIKY